MKSDTIGKLRQRIIFESSSDASDSQGGYTRTWSTYATVWAEVKPVSAKERYFAHKVEHDVTHKVRVRYRSDLTFTTHMRILFGSRYLQIHGMIKEDERNQWVLFLCEEGVGS